MAMEGKSRRFAVACGVLSQYVRAEQKMAAAAAAAVVAAPARATTLSLMPGAEVVEEEQREVEEAGPATAPLTIFYGGRVVVFEEFPADKAAEVMRMASSGASAEVPAANPREGAALADMPIMRKVSLQRFFAKRKDRLAASAPYARPSPADTKASGSEEKPTSWLGLAASASASAAAARRDSLTIAL